MLKIGKLTDYGVLMLSTLAEQPAVLRQTESLAETTGLTLPTTRKVMKALSDAGLVQAQRGAKGGYRLARAASMISLRDVVEAFEGPIALTECTQDHHGCDITEQCSLADGWGGINQLLMQMLARVSLADVKDPTIVDRLTQGLMAHSPRISLVNL